MHLPVLLDEYGIEIEADFQEYYRLDLLDLYRGVITPAKVMRLLCALPAESRFIRAAVGPKAEWSTSEHLLASIADTLQAANWQRGGGKGGRPKPIPRPGDDKSTSYGKTNRSQEEIRKYLSDLKAGKFEKG